MRALFALLALLAMAPVASAEPSPDEQARALNKKGVELLEQRDFLGALEAFRGAYAKHPSVKILLNIGTACRNLGKNAEAADAYEKYLNDPAADAQKKREVTELLKKLDAGLSKLRLDVEPGDARVFVDGRPAGGALVRMEPGTHAVVAEKDGFVTADQTVSVAAGEERSVQLKLAPKVAVAPTPPPAPVVAPTPPPVHVETPAPPAATFAPADEGPSRRKIVMWSLGGVGVATLGAGIYFGLSARSDWNDVNAHCPNKQCTDPIYVTRAGDASTSANISTFCFLAGGTALVAAAVLWWQTPTPSRSAVHVVPMAGAGFAGALLEGTLP